MRTPPPGRPLSVVIGRIVIRLLFVGFLMWAVMSGYSAYREHQRAQEIAPVHEFAIGFLTKFKSGDFFSVQERLDPVLHHIISIDWLANFAKNSELNATKTGSWGDWNKTEETNSTVYFMDGEIVYITGHKNRMQWQVKKAGEKMNILNLRIGKRSLRADDASALRPLQ